ncbi:MAG: pentapeptide repeat-containing protein [Kiloniellales bacterium]
MRFAPLLVLASGLAAATPAAAFDPAEVAKLAAEGDCIYCDLSRLEQPGLALPGANLSGSNLSQANLSGADLAEAQLSASDLTGAKLGGALLAEAKLDRALLAGADLSNADLSGASLRHADLRDANLSGAELSHADLFGADLRGTDLSGTDLSKADLRWAKVQDLLAPGEAAKLEGAVAAGADLRFVKGLTPEMSAKLCGDPETRHSLEGAVLWFCEPLEKGGARRGANRGELLAGQRETDRGAGARREQRSQAQQRRAHRWRSGR